MRSSEAVARPPQVVARRLLSVAWPRSSVEFSIGACEFGRPHARFPKGEQDGGRAPGPDLGPGLAGEQVTGVLPPSLEPAACSPVPEEARATDIGVTRYLPLRPGVNRVRRQDAIIGAPLSDHDAGRIGPDPYRRTSSALLRQGCMS